MDVNQAKTIENLYHSDSAEDILLCFNILLKLTTPDLKLLMRRHSNYWCRRSINIWDEPGNVFIRYKDDTMLMIKWDGQVVFYPNCTKILDLKFYGYDKIAPLPDKLYSI